MDIPASIMAAAQDQRLDFRTIKNEANAGETNEEKEVETFWSHHQTQQPGKDHHPRDHCREERQMETSKNLGERYIEEWARANIGEATRMAERRDLWCTVIDVTAAQP